MSKTIKVMTFNLRTSKAADGPNCFANRKPLILDVLRREKPDVIGFQEATEEMLLWLKQALRSYYVLGHGRNPDNHGEGVATAFRKDRFDLHAFGQEWLSFTPDQPGSRIEGVEQSHCPRVFSRTELLYKNSSEVFSFYNVHTDYQSDSCVFLECGMLMRKIGERGGKFILVGDFNVCPDNGAIALINATQGQFGTVDVTAKLGDTFHGFGKKEPKKIDYIFTNCKTDVEKTYVVPDGTSDGNYYSDHHALCAFPVIP